MKDMRTRKREVRNIITRGERHKTGVEQREIRELARERQRWVKKKWLLHLIQTVTIVQLKAAHLFLLLHK